MTKDLNQPSIPLSLSNIIGFYLYNKLAESNVVAQGYQKDYLSADDRTRQELNLTTLNNTEMTVEDESMIQDEDVLAVDLVDNNEDDSVSYDELNDSTNIASLEESQWEDHLEEQFEDPLELEDPLQYNEQLCITEEETPSLSENNIALEILVEKEDELDTLMDDNSIENSSLQDETVLVPESELIETEPNTMVELDSGEMVEIENLETNEMDNVLQLEETEDISDNLESSLTSDNLDLLLTNEEEKSDDLTVQNNDEYEVELDLNIINEAVAERTNEEPMLSLDKVNDELPPLVTNDQQDFDYNIELNALNDEEPELDLNLEPELNLTVEPTVDLTLDPTPVAETTSVIEPLHDVQTEVNNIVDDDLSNELDLDNFDDPTEEEKDTDTDELLQVVNDDKPLMDNVEPLHKVDNKDVSSKQEFKNIMDFFNTL